ncbi:MAG: AEC family transporter [Chloroflexota bacterium]
MHIFDAVFQSVAALLAIGVLGFWIVKRNIIPENILSFLSTLAIDIALPSIVFANIVLKFNPSALPDWWQLPVWWLLFAAASLALTMILMFISARDTRREFAISLFFQNGIFFPLIVMTGVFGSETPFIAQLFIFIIFHPTLYFSTYHLFFRHGSGRSTAHSHIRWQRIVNPVLIATLIAVAVRLTGADGYLPAFVIRVFQMLGDMTLPLLMLILGGSLYVDFQKKGRFYFLEMAKFVVTKNVLFPLVFLGLLMLVRPDYNIALLIMLESAVPPITGIPIVTEREGGNRSITNQFILASFVFSIITIPLVFLIFNRVFVMP